MNKEYLIKTLQLKKVGRKTTRKMLTEESFGINTDNEWQSFVMEASATYKLPDYDQGDFDEAKSAADSILSDAEKHNIQIVSQYDKEYPALLLKTDDPPLLLNYKGDLDCIHSYPTIAVIGTRKPSSYGYKSGERFAELFTAFGFTIVSGLAIGCDTAGHIGCLNKGGKTVAVLANALNTTYPKKNEKLAQDILDNNGLLISEYFTNESTRFNFFVERDRIQAGLSLGVFVVETGLKGGTMHTVKFALKAKRTLAALKHPAEKQCATSKGNELLIERGDAIGIGGAGDIDELKRMLLEQ